MDDDTTVRVVLGFVFLIGVIYLYFALRTGSQIARDNLHYDIANCRALVEEHKLLDIPFNDLTLREQFIVLHYFKVQSDEQEQEQVQ